MHLLAVLKPTFEALVAYWGILDRPEANLGHLGSDSDPQGQGAGLLKFGDGGIAWNARPVDGK